MSETETFPREISPLLIHLLKSVLYQEQQPALWQTLLNFQPAVKAYFHLIGLEIHQDETEGYAFLRQHSEEFYREHGQQPLPRLVQRRPLSFEVSLLCVLLRKKLAEQDFSGGDTRLVLGREQLLDLLRVFLPEGENQAKLMDKIDRHISKVEELGFLRRLAGEQDSYEVRRILKAFVDAEWVAGLEDKLKAYQTHAGGGEDDPKDG